MSPTLTKRIPLVLAAFMGGFASLVLGCGPQEPPVLVSYAQGEDADQLESQERALTLESQSLAPRIDKDRDGAPVWIDCDDRDAEVYPGAEELCDEKDNDCNFLVDDDPIDGDTYYVDGDGDGYGDVPVLSCDGADLYVEVDGDCDDSREDVYPDAEATCDGIDTNCDGSVDDEGLYCDELDGYDPGQGDSIDDPSYFDPGAGDELDDMSSFDPGEGDGLDDMSFFDPNLY